MKVNPQPLIIENKDTTYSQSGMKDFVVPEDSNEVKTINITRPSPRPRTRRSETNSYT